MNKTELVELVRARIYDYARTNRLLNYTAEFTPEDYLTALESALREFNSSPPVIASYGLGSFPSNILETLIVGAIYKLLSSAVFKKARNFAGIKDDGIYVNAEENISFYMKLLDFTRNEFELKRDAAKASMNIESLF